MIVKVKKYVRWQVQIANISSFDRAVEAQVLRIRLPSHYVGKDYTGTLKNVIQIGTLPKKRNDVYLLHIFFMGQKV